MNRLVVFALILSALTITVGMSHVGKQRQALSVKISPITQGELADTILSSGNLEFDKQIQIRSELTGRVVEVDVTEGDFVEQGQTLMRLDSTIYEANLQRASAKVDTQEITIRRTKSVLADLQKQLELRNRLFHSEGGVTEETIQDFKHKVKIAQDDVDIAEKTLNEWRANLAIAEENLRKTVYRAPISGFLASVEIKPGETVIAGSTNIIGSPLMTLADPATMIANLRVDEADIANVHLGQEVEVYVASHPREAIQGKVFHIATSARTNGEGKGLHFKVKVLLDSTDKNLHSGMSCRGEIIMAQRDGTLTVPIAAIQQNEEGYFVWAVEEGQALKREVNLGLASDLFQEVVSGVTPDEQIIVGPARTIAKLKNGTSVKIN